MALYFLMTAALAATASTAPVSRTIIRDVTMTARGDDVTLDVRTSEPIDTAHAHGRIGEHSVIIWMDTVRVGKSRVFSFVDGRQVWAQQFPHGVVELQMPTDGLLCSGPVRITATQAGLSASVHCPATATAKAAAPVKESVPDVTRAGLIAADLRPAAPVLPMTTAPTTPTPWWLVVLLGALGAVAYLVARRRTPADKLVEVVQSYGLGPKRSLVVARVGDKMLVLSSSEAGLHLITELTGTQATRENALEQAAHALRAQSQAGTQPPLRAPPLHARPNITAFEELLAESSEDESLRRKLAMGMTGRVQ